jgi:hypothetical protein
MTDKTFKKVLIALYRARKNYLELLKLAEDEIVKRYGVHPSDIDNDEWIDSYHSGNNMMTIEDVDKSMKNHIKTHNQ